MPIKNRNVQEWVWQHYSYFVFFSCIHREKKKVAFSIKNMPSHTDLRNATMRTFVYACLGIFFSISVVSSEQCGFFF